MKGSPDGQQGFFMKCLVVYPTTGEDNYLYTLFRGRISLLPFSGENKVILYVIISEVTCPFLIGHKTEFTTFPVLKTSTKLVT